MEHLRTRVLSGLGWSAASQMLGQALQFGITVVLAHLLRPKEYGLLAMVLVLTEFAAVFSDLSLGASIIQKQDVSARHLNSVFWLNIGVGGLFTLLFCLAAPLVALFYGEPSLRLLTMAVAINFPLTSLNVVQIALLDKSLNFRTRFWVNTISISVAGAVALSLALAGAGVWSLVAQSLVTSLVGTAVIWRLSAWRPSRSFDLSAVKELMQFSKHLVGFGVVNYWGRNIDKLVIGRVAGSAALGIYGLASRLMQLPLTNVTNITSSVMFPALSTMQEDVSAMKRLYLRGNRMIALLTFPMMIGLSVLAEPIIVTAYGDQWRDAIAVVRILCFAGMFQSVYNTASWLLLSFGRTDTLFRLGLYATFIRVAGIAIGIHWGLIGAAWAYFLGGFLVWYLNGVALAKLVQLRFTEILGNLIGPFACAAFMGILLWLSDRWLLSSQIPWMHLAMTRLAILSAAGALIYLLLIWRLRLRAWQDLRDILRELTRRPAARVQPCIE
jgi:O-antigen/teichoic acid export membrane protein